MAQHPTTHIYAAVRFEAKSSLPFTGEIATWGMRIGSWPTASDPGRSAGDVQLYEYLTNDASVTRTTSAWNITQGWAGDSGSLNITDADQDSIANAWLAFLTSVKDYLSGDYQLESVRLYNIGRNGLTGSAPNIYEPATPFSSTTASLLPPQVAAAVSLGSAMRGPAGRGRFYVGPLSNGAQATHGTISTTFQGLLGAAGATLVGALEAVGGTEIASHPVIVHRASMNGIQGSTRGAVVNGVRVGSELDTQQRRRRGVPEAYTSYALP